MDEQEQAGLRAEIEEQHETVYRFCKISGLNKSTVYMVLSGRYPGDMARQAGRIRAALAGDSPRAEKIRTVIQREACALCKKRRACDGSPCARIFDAQAQAVMKTISQIG
ncbi:MAG: hypothetical protein KKE73_09635 [Proteobacteria bacterium]|nr:hypothetical protein [Pseudomonadota bacterium]